MATPNFNTTPRVSLPVDSGPSFNTTQPHAPASTTALSSSITSTTPINTPTTLQRQPFFTVTRKEGPVEEFLAFQSIIFLPEFSKHSFEEVRLADYEKGAGPIVNNSRRGLFGGSGFRGSMFEQKSFAGSGDAGSRNTFSGIASGKTGGMSTNPPASSTLDESSPPLAKRLKYGDNDIFKVLVGSKKVSFNVHKNFVCGVSPFFHGTCNSLSKEGLKDEVYLPEADPEVFDAFMEWVYTGKVKFSAWPINKTSKPECNAWWSFGTKLYLLAHYLQCTTFGNAVIDSISRAVTNKQVMLFPGPNLIDLLYKSTPGDCGLRRIFVALNVWRSGAGYWRGDDEWRTRLSGLPVEYSNDLVVQLLRRNHQFDQNPFAGDTACHVFRDKELGSQAVE
ncbi:hypothetical protein EPUS_07953 [Endocarpon pusillum Z07020]|uniref:BTB domain-containing protein n=1 Tax=Endocarpon pusillum (strain Z07020 / HMAS-L-300199) TaxID=1263415 RepID=U1GH81_ENDPU|nr:uncharacterized protein EPUS_07953 [Endocarpon pusillum Z07020]ERF77047.1 hypothetical protein EPUS_07953 [Endocarpon pusillum Z07020]